MTTLTALQNRTDDEIRKIAEANKALLDDYKYNQIKYRFCTGKGKFSRSAYQKHWDFMQRGAYHRFRALMGGNRSGKSYTGATEVVYHATGEYPEGWQGKRFKNPKTIWIVAESAELFRDSLQICLFGQPGEEVGTGLFPKDSIISTSARQGVSGCIGSALIKHKNGGVVSIIVKTYEMKRENFQAAKVDFILFDEEPPQAIYVECLMRLMGTGKENGAAILMFTPLKGLSDVILRFLPDGKYPDSGVHPEYPDRFVTQVTWEDVPHLTEEDKAMMLAEMSPLEREARTKGIPMLGSGRIYPVSEDFVIVEPFRIPDYYPKAFGFDFGWHKTAAVWVAQDPQSKIMYVYAEYKKGELIDAVHAAALKTKGSWIKGASDPSGGGRTDDGRLKIELYHALGVQLEPGENSNVLLGQILNLFETGALKIFSTCVDLIKEIRVFRYDTKNPNVPAPKQDDHECDALKYVISIFNSIAQTEEEAMSGRYDDDLPSSLDRHRDPDTGY